jgi:quercetin dioxygenase-like cupin family protein
MNRAADRPLILHPNEIGEIDRGGGIRTRRLVGKWNTGEGHLTSGITLFAPGTMIAPHAHNVEETIMVLEGRATVYLDGEPTDLEVGDVTWVPGSVRHWFANRGESAMRIYWVYGGREVTRTLSETGETFPHLSERDHQVGRVVD